MSINWIATNPRSNTKNKTNQISMSDAEFETLMRMIIHNRNNYEEKLELVLQTKGFFSAEQASQIISTFARPKDKIKAVQILEPKLVSMTCQEARNILAAVSIPEDKLEALEYVKRALNDANTQEGLDYIVSCFTFEEHKLISARILQTVVARRGVQIAAGGHQGYAPLGGLYTSAPPNNPHIYGAPIEQVKNFPNHRLKTDQSATIFDVDRPPRETLYSSNTTEGSDYVPTKFVRSDYLDANKNRLTFA